MSQNFLPPPISKYALAAASREEGEDGAPSFEEKARAVVGPTNLRIFEKVSRIGASFNIGLHYSWLTEIQSRNHFRAWGQVPRIR